MATNPPCKKRCDKSGLSILLVRPTAVAKDAAFAPIDANKLLTHEGAIQALGLPALKQSRYALRLLRQEGYVYVYYPANKPEKLGKKEWQIYRVGAQGALLPEGEFNFEKTEPACTRKSTHPHDLRTICIEEPKKVGTVWIGFSMNWWTETIKNDVAQAIQKKTKEDAEQAKNDKAGATKDKVKVDVAKDDKANADAKKPSDFGMVKVDLTAATQPSGFKADALLISKHVADYALPDFRHAGVESATPFYPPKPKEAVSVSLAMVMRKQAEGSPDTKDKEQVLAIPDPVGLAADLNGIRIAKDKALKEAFANSTHARTMALDSTLNGMEAEIRAAGILLAQQVADGSTSQNAWNKVKDERYYKESGYSWEPVGDGSKAADGSLNGRIIHPPNARRAQAIETLGKGIGEDDWKKIGSQLDKALRAKLVKEAKDQMKKDCNQLALFEADWLEVMRADKTLNYFACHFDENDPNKPLSPVRPGEIYASESCLIHVPQPLSIESHYKTYVEQLLNKSITDPQAVALRSMFGNQKDLITRIEAMLVGDPWRGNDDNMRDKTYDVLKGLITMEWGPKYSWMTFALVGFAGGHFTALSAAVFGLARNGARATYLQKLPKLALTHQIVLDAIEAAVSRGELNMPVLVVRELTAEQALRRVKGAPVGAYSQRDLKAARQNKKAVEILELSDVNTESGVLEKRPGEQPRMRGHAKRAPSTKAFEALEARAAALGADDATETAINRALEYRKIEVSNLMAEAKVDTRLGIGSAVVQAIGLFHAIPKLFEDPKGPDAEAERRNALLGAFDGVLGFGGALADTVHSAQKAMLMEKASGKQLVKLNTNLMVLKTVAAVAGMASGALNAVMSAYQARDAKSKGDMEAYGGYLAATSAFGLTTLTSSYAVGDAASRNAVSRFIARKILMRAAGAAVARVVVTEVAVATTAATVAGAVTGVGTVLLIIGVVATAYAVATSRDELQRWASRTYFGNDKEHKFNSAAEEDAGLDEAFKEIERKAAAEKEKEKKDEEQREKAKNNVHELITKHPQVYLRR